jgi:3-phenylpropionate/trans-cinnamate dioxygenase ferredoxin component
LPRLRSAFTYHSSLSRGVPLMPHWVRVAHIDELLPGQRIITEIEGYFIAVFNVDDEFFCIEDVCTHDGGPVAEGELDGYAIECPRHGARFDIRTGKVLSFPAVVPVPTFPVKLEGDEIFVDIAELVGA